jgi:branched-chain amino acid transport system substrate-binding protein
MSVQHAGRGFAERIAGPVRLAAIGAMLAAGTMLGSSALAQELQPIPLGQVAPFTGAGAEFGEYYRDGAALAVEHINEAAQQVFGGPVFSDHIVEDTGTLPTPAIEAARKLVEVDGVPAIVGGWSSGVTVAIATSVTIPSGVLQVSNGSTSPLISVLPEDRDADLLFRTTASDALQGVVAAQLVAGEIFDDYQFESASTIYINNPYGQGLSNAFARSFQLRGGVVHAQIPHPEETQPTYTSLLASALQNDPEILIAVSYPGHSATFLQEARDIFGVTTWQLVDGNMSADVVEAVGAGDLEGVYATTPGQDPNIPGFANFAEEFEARTGRTTIPPFTESAYDAAMLIGLAAVKAAMDGETDLTGTVLRDRLRDVANAPGEEIVAGRVENIVRALELLRDGEDIHYSGAAGPADFDENGDVITPIAITRLTNGEFETVHIVSAEDIPDE